MPIKPTSQYYNNATHQLQDAVPYDDYEAVRKKLRVTSYQLTQARAENTTLRRELKRIRALAGKMLQPPP